jgi:ferritin-like metal-binding protein YciE
MPSHGFDVASRQEELSMNQEQIEALLYEALETEMGGVQIYETAVQCAVNPDLKKEWQEYLEQTKEHVEKMRDVLQSFGLDPETETPGRKVVRTIGEALVEAMQTARSAGKPEAAELVATECVVLAETKDHLNWELMGAVAKKGNREDMALLREAHKEIEEEEDEHLYHTMGWSRELWMSSLGLPAALPPPEETRDVKTMMEAARAKESRNPKRQKTRTSQPRASKRSATSKKKASGTRSSAKKSSSRR